MIRRISVRAIIVHDGKLLCVRLNPSDWAPHNNTFWCVPGGGLDEGEDLLSGLTREMLEETGTKPVIGDLLYIQQFKDSKAEYLEFLFNITNTQDYLHIDLGKTTHGAAEIAELEFVDPTGDINLLPEFLKTTNISSDIAAGKTKYYNNLT